MEERNLHDNDMWAHENRIKKAMEAIDKNDPALLEKRRKELYDEFLILSKARVRESRIRLGLECKDCNKWGMAQKKKEKIVWPVGQGGNCPICNADLTSFMKM